VVKVLDFGLVRSVQAEAELTAAGMFMGTPLTMSPEAIRTPSRVDGRSDIYSLGAVAYYLLAGIHVFEAPSPMEICTMHLHNEPAPLAGRVAELDPGLERLVLDCLAKDPARRPPSARALIERLEACASHAEWTAERARAFWLGHPALLNRASKVMATAPTGLADTNAKPA
jgi:serine/threonine protein kinase